MDVIVLAGENKDTVNKAFYKIKDKYMIEYVVETLRESESIDRIAVVGPKDKLESAIGGIVDYVIEGTGSIVSNILLALECFPEANKILVVTSGIPMITREAMEDFIARCSERDVDLYYSIVDKKVNDQKYPGVRRTYARLWEGRFTGGNVFCFNPA
ncbi:MAG TPA: nucleotidyltransferase family protein, partial [Bacillota bacterium]|nr:nucleotidyltransferase family protein [Bacillota bacterium]